MNFKFQNIVMQIQILFFVFRIVQKCHQNFNILYIIILIIHFFFFWKVVHLQSTFTHKFFSSYSGISSSRCLYPISLSSNVTFLFKMFYFLWRSYSLYTLDLSSYPINKHLFVLLFILSRSCFGTSMYIRQPKMHKWLTCGFYKCYIFVLEWCFCLHV
jgi:hypothetical protein